MLKRGLREGCASSCTLYNVFHNCALEELNRVTPGIRLRCSPLLRCNEKMRGGRGDAPPAEDTLQYLHTPGFADDTTTIFPAPKLSSVREQVRTVLGDRGESVHPGKDEFMTTGIYRPNETLSAGHHHHVRMLGAWIDTDGRARMGHYYANQSCVQGVVQAEEAVGQFRSPTEGTRFSFCICGLG